MAVRGNTASTLHYFGSGLAGDDRFVVERFRALAFDHICSVQSEPASAKGRRKTKRIAVSHKEAKAMRLDRTEIAICAGPRTCGGKQAQGLS